MLYNTKVKSDLIPSVTHVDKTCRPQTLNANQNYYFYSLLDEFEKLTGLPLLLNTSLNEAGYPIVGNTAHAKNILKNTQLDHLCIGDEIL